MCGQKARTSDIDFSYFINELPFELFQVNRGLIYTIRRLSVAPGRAINQYIEGKRIRYFPPFSYVILMASFFLLLRTLVNLYLAETVEFNVSKSNSAPFLGLIFVGFSPMLAFSCFMIFRKKSGWNFWKYEIAVIYLMGHTLFLWSIFKFVLIPLPVLQEYSGYLISLSFIYVFTSLVSMHFRYFKIKINAFFRSILVFVLFILFSSLIMVLFMAVFSD